MKKMIKIISIILAVLVPLLLYFSKPVFVKAEETSPDSNANIITLSSGDVNSPDYPTIDGVGTIYYNLGTMPLQVENVSDVGSMAFSVSNIVIYNEMYEDLTYDTYAIVPYASGEEWLYTRVRIGYGDYFNREFSYYNAGMNLLFYSSLSSPYAEYYSVYYQVRSGITEFAYNLQSQNSVGELVYVYNTFEDILRDTNHVVRYSYIANGLLYTTYSFRKNTDILYNIFFYTSTSLISVDYFETVFYLQNSLDFTRFASYKDGYDAGYEDGEYKGYQDGFDIGKDEGYQEGYKDGNLKGYDDGYDKGYVDGYEDGEDVGYDDGFDVGYNEGVDDGFNSREPFETIVGACNEFLNISIFGKLTIGNIIIIVAGISIMLGLSKLLRS